MNEENLKKLKRAFPKIHVESSNIEAAAKCDVVFLAVHPPVMMETLTKIERFVNRNSIVISLAPKITIDKVRSVLKDVTAIARVNPSAAGIINQGMNPVDFSDQINMAQKAYIQQLLNVLGKAPEADETKIEAYAVICIMGSTYFCYQLKLLEELGIQYGMDSNEVKEAISEMMKGTMNTLFFSEIPSDEVMDLVPVKPMVEYEDLIKGFYKEKLNGIFNKIKP